jgi:hypothetical protein
MIAEFVDRTEEVKEVCKPVDEDNRLLIIYGESGVGKTCLLKKAITDLHQSSPSVIAFIVDFESFASEESNQIAALVNSIIENSGGVLSEDKWHNPEQAAGQIFERLSEIALRRPVYLMFDTTESLQENMGFWEWIQKYIAEPFVVEGKVKLIFAGRVPAPLRRGEVGNARKLLALGAIAPEDKAIELVHNALDLANPNLKASTKLKKAVTGLILKFSFGHPKLTEEMATYLAHNWPSQVTKATEREICERVVKPFIDDTLFEKIDPTWKDILWWASILDSFSADILHQYLNYAAPELIENKDDYFFLEGIGELKTRKTVIWRAGTGENLHGLIRNITQRCLQTLYPEKYQKACHAAGKTFEAIAEEFSEEPEYAKLYREMATSHYQKCEPKEPKQ